MKSKISAVLTLTLAEAAFVHAILCPAYPLSPDAEALHDALAEGLQQHAELIASGIEVVDTDVELTIDIELLDEIVPLFASLTPELIAESDIDPEHVGFNVGLGLLTAQIKLHRTLKGTPDEIDAVEPTKARRDAIRDQFKAAHEITTDEIVVEPSDIPANFTTPTRSPIGLNRLSNLFGKPGFSRE